MADTMREWQDLSADEQRTCIGFYARTRDIRATAEHFGLRVRHLQQMWQRLNIAELVDEIIARTREKTVKEESDWAIEAVQKVDQAIKWLEDRRDAGEMQRPSISELDRLLRLKAFLLGGPDSRSEIGGTIALVPVFGEEDPLSADAHGADDDGDDTGGE